MRKTHICIATALLCIGLIASAHAGDPVLCAERLGNPIYNGKTDAEFIEMITAKNIDRYHECVDRGKLLDAVNDSDWSAQTNADLRLQFLSVFGGDGCVNPAPGGFAFRTAMRVFGGTTSISAMRDVAKYQISRAEELGRTERVRTADVENCQ